VARIQVESEVQGRVWKTHVAVGDRVDAGDVLMVLESMKMEVSVEAPAGGVVVELRSVEGAPVAEGEIVAVIDG
jgi:biotin carboxyl carrier protein